MTTIKPVSIGDNTPDGARAFVQHAKDFAVRAFSRGQQVHPFALIAGERDPITCQLQDRPTVAYLALDPSFFEDASTKDQVWCFLRDSCIKAEAYAVAFVHEMWMATGEAAMNRPRGMSLEHFPGRTESVLVIYQHAAFGRGEIRGAFREILRPARSKARLAPWMEIEAAMTMGRKPWLQTDEELANTERMVTTLRQFAKALDMPRESALASVRRAVERWNAQQPFARNSPVEYVVTRLMEADW